MHFCWKRAWLLIPALFLTFVGMDNVHDLISALHDMELAIPSAFAAELPATSGLGSTVRIVDPSAPQPHFWFSRLNQNATNTAGPDLSLSKSHSGGFYVGSPSAFYNFSISNFAFIGPPIGPFPAPPGPTTGSITLTDTLPAGLTFDPAGPTSPGWSCSASGQTVTCTNPGPLAAPAISSFSILVGIGNAAVGAVTNTASVSTPGDANPANNTASDTATVMGLPPPEECSLCPGTEPTPELDSIILFGIGAVGLAAYAWRQRRGQRSSSRKR
jgi:hypothetical protein